MTLRLALAAGGTAGHIYPAVAVADALAATGTAVEPFFLGTPAGLEAGLMRRLGRELHLLPGLPFQCRGPIAKALAVAETYRAITAARRFLRAHRIDAVIGFGGYASIGPVLAARTLGLRTAIVDGNAKLGLANRILAPLVQRRFTGPIPLRRSIIDASRDAVTGPPENAATVVVFGDAFLDLRIAAALRGIASSEFPLRVLHRTVEPEARALQLAYGEHVELTIVDRIDDVARVCRDAHFVVGRGGASTLAEVSILGRPSLIVPLRAAAENHQADNARPHAAAGAALVTSEDAWSQAHVERAVASILRDRDAWLRMSAAARSLVKFDAAAAVARDVLALCAVESPLLPPPATTLAPFEGVAR